MINCEVLRIITARGAGDAMLKRLSRYANDDSHYSLKEICNDVHLMCSIGIGFDVAKNIYENNDKALFVEEQLVKDNVDMCWWGENHFPEKLKKLSVGHIPAVLFYKGNYNLLMNKGVGFTGSRKVSDSGIRITDISAKKLSTNGITVISGYAKGVDITAHRAALMNGGNTVFVIAEGILQNRVKSEVKEFLDDKNHLFISQFLPNSPWLASNAMKRNNTIIGLSDAMILIEACMDGGTFNAGEQSLKNKKPLFVVEYGEKKATAEGNDFFLQHGAMPLRGDKDGKPVLKRIYSIINHKESEMSYEQLKLNLC